MKYFLSVSVLFLSFSSFSQSVRNFVKHYANNTATTPVKDIRDSYVLADNVILRKEPSIESTALTSLSIATSVKLLSEASEVETIDGIKSHWYKTIIHDGTVGYLWGGLIAQNQFGSSQPGGIKFLVGLEKVVTEQISDDMGRQYDKTAFYTQIRAIKNNAQIAKYSVKNLHQTFDLSATESSGFGTSNMGPCGLENTQDIIRLHVPCRGGCGCSTGNVYIAWDGTNFHYMGEAWSTADAQYSEGNSYIFPNSMKGESGFVIKSINRIEWDQRDDQTERKDTREEFLEYYIWNGEKLLKTQRRTESIFTEIDNY